MPKDTKFNQAWLERTDNDGNQAHNWLKQGTTETTFQCTLCKTGDRECGNQGWSAIYQHMNTKGHMKNMKLLKNNLKFVIEPPKSQQLSTNNLIKTGSLRLDDIRKAVILNFDEQVTSAETVWALTVARRGFTYNSCDTIGDTFRSMFPDSKIAQQFNMQSKKLSYVMSHGIGPYVHRDV
ncbi:unnamed protein product, partial [Rotaria sp. Silwood2]